MFDGKFKYLTKALFVNGHECRKWLWLAFNAPERLPKVDKSGQHRLDEVRQIGEVGTHLKNGEPLKGTCTLGY
jgi:hypothetical protein